MAKDRALAADAKSMGDKQTLRSWLEDQGEELVGWGIVVGSGAAAIAVAVGRELWRSSADGVSLGLVLIAAVFAMAAGLVPLRVSALSLLRGLASGGAAVAGSLLVLWLGKPHAQPEPGAQANAAAGHGVALLLALGVAWSAALIADSRMRRLESRTAAAVAERDAKLGSDRHAELLAEIGRVSAALGSDRLRSTNGRPRSSIRVDSADFVLATRRIRRRGRNEDAVP